MKLEIKKINGLTRHTEVYEPGDVVQVTIAYEPLWLGTVRCPVPADPFGNSTAIEAGWYVVDPHPDQPVKIPRLANRREMQIVEPPEINPHGLEVD